MGMPIVVTAIQRPSILPHTERCSHLTVSGICSTFANLSLMSRNARDDKNGRFGERAPQLTMLAKLAILAIFCQFRQIS